MRVVQSCVPIAGLLGTGGDPDEYAISPKIVLIDEGVSLGHGSEDGTHP